MSKKPKKVFQFSTQKYADPNEIDWNELGPVHTEILEELCNDLWQLLHPGEPNSWTMPAQIVAEIKERLNRPKEVHVKAEYVPMKEVKIGLEPLKKKVADILREEVERKLQAYADGKEEL